MSDLGAQTRALVTLWAPRLGIAERIAVELFPAGDPEARCSMKPARMIPEAQGLWDFVLEIDEGIHPDDLTHTVVHELVHLLIEPLREAYLAKQAYPMWKVTGDPTAAVVPAVEMIGSGSEQVWETVIQRIADAFERAYSA